MKSIPEHIEQVKGQPHHIRKRIAFTAAVIGTGIIALIWLVSSAATGVFDVQGSSFADSAGQGSVEATASTDNSHPANSGIAGAAAAVQSASAPVHIEIVDTVAGTSSAKKAEQTVIPF